MCLQQDAQHCAVNRSRRTSARGPTGSKSVGAAVDLLKPACSENTCTLRVRYTKESVITVCSDNHAEHVHALCGQNGDSLMFKQVVRMVTAVLYTFDTAVAKSGNGTSAPGVSVHRQRVRCPTCSRQACVFVSLRILAYSLRAAGEM